MKKRNLVAFVVWHLSALFTLSHARSLCPADSLPSEPGITCGVSAAFAGILKGQVVRIGGCNFPEEPLAPQSKKRYYQGIYVLQEGDTWQRVGDMAAPIAYGGSATIPNGVVLVGGVTPEGATNAVWLLQRKGRHTVCKALPSLPFPIDNTAACAVDHRVYVAGGNVAGVPSRVLLMLDVRHPEEGWQRLADFPGNPRVQPVLAAAQGKLYLWGGFAGKHAGKEATLNTDGYAYDLQQGAWTTPIAGPLSSEGQAVSLGGGTAVTLPDGRIAVFGGVHATIFLNALKSQPDDYLSHPEDWYRFNPTVWLYHPQSGSWESYATDAAYARAGASAVSKGWRVYLLGGERKPRIRTPKTAIITISPNQSSLKP